MFTRLEPATFLSELMSSDTTFDGFLHQNPQTGLALDAKRAARGEITA